MFATNGAMMRIQTSSLSLKGERTFVSFVLLIANKKPLAETNKGVLQTTVAELIDM